MSYRIKYPRRTFVRQSLRLLGCTFIPLLADIRITGKENFPKQGPLIVVGNHTAVMEVVMMGLYTPWAIEFMGSIDILHEKFTAFIINLYGYLPIFRGNASPSSLKTGLEVLKQDGVLGIFPEGGIWEPAIRKAQSGVAWLSYHAQAPILPVGFGSTRGALKQMFSWERPVLNMNVGAPIPPVRAKSGKSQKQHFQDEANHIMDAVWDLIPEEARIQEQAIQEERFELLVETEDGSGRPVALPPELEPRHGPAFSKFTHRKTLVNNYVVNLHMPEVACLTRLAGRPSPGEIVTATQSILNHLEQENPYYFTYRYGQREGKAMEAGVREVYNLALWARESQFSLRLLPLRRFKDLASGQEVVLDRPEEFDKL